MAATTVRHYSDDAIDITYDPHRCIHAGECMRGLPAVFDSTRRPWIMPSEASANEIAHVIARCPSGALHFRRCNGGPDESLDLPTTIVPTTGGPFYVRGLRATYVRRLAVLSLRTSGWRSAVASVTK